MSAADGLPKCSFATIAFPAEMITLIGRGRQHIHEFPKAPGGAPEKLGRGLWMLTVRGNFQDRFAGYTNLYPQSMNGLRDLYEQQATAQFVHPTTGPFNAFITSWRQIFDPAKIRSGEKVDIEFLEDQASDFLTQSTDTGGSSQLASSQATLDANLAAMRASLRMRSSDMDVFSAIRATVNAVLALKDQADLYAAVVSSKAAELVSLCQQADTLLPLQTPNAISIIDPLHDIWAIAQANANTAQASGLSEWVAPTPMTLMEISQLLYSGDASHQDDLLSLNAGRILDGYQVKAGTSIFYDPTA